MFARIGPLLRTYYILQAAEWLRQQHQTMLQPAAVCNILRLDSERTTFHRDDCCKTWGQHYLLQYQQTTMLFENAKKEVFRFSRTVTRARGAQHCWRGSQHGVNI